MFDEPLSGLAHVTTALIMERARVLPDKLRSRVFPISFPQRLSTNTLGSKMTVVVSLYLRFMAFGPLH